MHPLFYFVIGRIMHQSHDVLSRILQVLCCELFGLSGKSESQNHCDWNQFPKWHHTHLSKVGHWRTKHCWWLHDYTEEEKTAISELGCQEGERRVRKKWNPRKWRTSRKLSQRPLIFSNSQLNPTAQNLYRIFCLLRTPSGYKIVFKDRPTSFMKLRCRLNQAALDCKVSFF